MKRATVTDYNGDTLEIKPDAWSVHPVWLTATRGPPNSHRGVFLCFTRRQALRIAWLLVRAVLAWTRPL